MSPDLRATAGQRTEPPTNFVSCFGEPPPAGTDHRFGVRLSLACRRGSGLSSHGALGVSSPTVTQTMLLPSAAYFGQRCCFPLSASVVRLPAPRSSVQSWDAAEPW